MVRGRGVKRGGRNGPEGWEDWRGRGLRNGHRDKKEMGIKMTDEE